MFYKQFLFKEEVVSVISVDGINYLLTGGPKLNNESR